MGPMGPMGMMGPEGMGMGMGPMGPPVQQKEVITLNSCVLLPPHPGQWVCLLPHCGFGYHSVPLCVLTFCDFLLHLVLMCVLTFRDDFCFIMTWMFVCCCNVMMFYDWSECVMSVLGTTEHSSCICIDTWQ